MHWESKNSALRAGARVRVKTTSPTPQTRCLDVVLAPALMRYLPAPALRALLSTDVWDTRSSVGKPTKTDGKQNRSIERPEQKNAEPRFFCSTKNDIRIFVRATLWRRHVGLDSLSSGFVFRRFFRFSIPILMEHVSGKNSSV